MSMIITAASIQHTEFSAWYPLFIGCTIKSKILPLPDDFIAWMKTDGVSLPPDTPVSMFHEARDDDAESWASDRDSEEDQTPEEEPKTSDEGAASDDEPGEEEPIFDFRDLNEMVTEALASLGGAVMPKLNWSAPQDAVWMNQGSMKCTAPGDIYLLLKASDFISHDLHYPFDGCTELLSSREDQSGGEGDGPADPPSRCSTPLPSPPPGCALATPPPPDCSSHSESSDLPMHEEKEKEETADCPTALQRNYTVRYTLVLRKWSNLNPRNNFRCFTRERSLLAVSQRHCSVFHPSLMDDADRIVATISRFHYDKVAHRFPDPNFVMDIYIDKNWRVWIIDFNVFAECTDSLLFSWVEPLLSSAIGEGVAPPSDAELRLVDSEVGVRTDPLSEYRAPIDMHGFVDAERLQEGESVMSGLRFETFMAECKGPK